LGESFEARALLSGAIARVFVMRFSVFEVVVFPLYFTPSTTQKQFVRSFGFWTRMLDLRGGKNTPFLVMGYCSDNLSMLQFSRESRVS